jgi:hypothetical protein
MNERWAVGHFLMSATLTNTTYIKSSEADASAFGKILASPLWGWLAVVAMVAAYVSASSEHQFIGAIVSAITFALVGSLFPSCRPVAMTPLCPWNWALFLFGFQLVVLPFSILVVGPSLGVLPRLPSDFAINMAMVLNALAFLTFAITYQYFYRRFEARKSKGLESRKQASIWIPSKRFVDVQIALGLVGFFLAFRNISNVVDYFVNPEYTLERFAQALHTLPGVASLFLRPFGGFALVMLWCGWIDRKSPNRSPRWAAVITLAAMVGVILCYFTFTYNRGSFVVPLIAMFAVVLKRGKQASLGVLVVAGMVLVGVLLIAPYWAIYRGGNLTADELLDSPAVSDIFADKIDLIDTIQMYGAGPQYSGFFLEASHWGTRPYLGTTLFPSIVEPIPVLGRTLGDFSGPVIYNNMIYGTPYIFDQIFPFSSEMFLNFNILGVIAGFYLLGIIAFWLQRGFEQASSALEVYIWQYTAVWVLFLIMGAISVTTEILFYFFWPIYVYLMGRRIAASHPAGEQHWQAQS